MCGQGRAATVAWRVRGKPVWGPVAARPSPGRTGETACGWWESTQPKRAVTREGRECEPVCDPRLANDPMYIPQDLPERPVPTIQRSEIACPLY